MADVCDKGVGAALFMALFRSLIRAAAEDSGPDRLGSGARSDFDPAVRLLHAVVLTNDYIARTHSRANMFATLFFGILEPATGALTYVNGGHEAPVLRTPSGEVRRLPPSGPAVGMLPGVAFEVRRERLEPGDLLLLFTDGVTEARDPEGVQYTEERLIALLDLPVSSGALLDVIEKSLLAHNAGIDPSDDMTIMAVRRKKEDK
jgi:sigma-B regulation protein RsbU (phosphoserine phosphatase)